ncbi:MAG: hypothetical protein ACYC4U_26385 [Pirellulaceae bacterium]
MAKTTRLGQKKCPGCGKWIKGTRTKVCPKCSYEFNGKKKAAPALKSEPAEPVVEKPTKVGDVITITQLRAVADLVTAVGGFERCHEMLDVIQDVGGMRRIKNVLEAMATAQVSQNTV